MNAALEKAREATQRMREEGITIQRLDPIEKSDKNPKSLRFAITAMCWDCVGGSASVNPRELIKNCDVGGKCPLYKVRPWQEQNKGE